MIYINQIFNTIKGGVVNILETIWQNPLSPYYFQGLLLSFIIYLFYIELNPKMGGIFFRPDSTGTFKFNFLGAGPMLSYPFKSLNFWNPNNWDLNWIVFSNIGAVLYTLLKYYQNLHGL
tara:strand:+ start:5876 stop:6232 length:357 start_codon:yes stop_codon:yes gene_type:complete